MNECGAPPTEIMGDMPEGKRACVRMKKVADVNDRRDGAGTRWDPQDARVHDRVGSTCQFVLSFVPAPILLASTTVLASKNGGGGGATYAEEIDGNDSASDEGGYGVQLEFDGREEGVEGWSSGEQIACRVESFMHRRRYERAESRASSPSVSFSNAARFLSTHPRPSLPHAP